MTFGECAREVSFPLSHVPEPSNFCAERRVDVVGLNISVCEVRKKLRGVIEVLLAGTAFDGGRRDGTQGGETEN